MQNLIHTVLACAAPAGLLDSRTVVHVFREGRPPADRQGEEYLPTYFLGPVALRASQSEKTALVDVHETIRGSSKCKKTSIKIRLRPSEAWA